jgi:flagellar hook assembly protein FlgD
MLGAAAPVATTLDLTDAAVDPGTISPNGDGEADSATVTYTTTAPATVTVTVVDANGQDVAALHGPVDEATGTHTVTFTGEGLADGRYTLRIDATDSERTVSRTLPVLVTRTLGSVGISPQAFSPNGDGRADRVTVRFTLLNPASMRVRVLRDGKWVATLLAGDLTPGSQVVRWDGSKRLGKLLDGSYTGDVEATDTVGTSSSSVSFTSDTHAPVVRILGGKPLRVWVSEPAVLTVRVNGHPLTAKAAAAGTVRVPWAGPIGRVRVVAWDAAGNVSRPVVRG